jgi:hypothetical protein
MINGYEWVITMDQQSRKTCRIFQAYKYSAEKDMTEQYSAGKD